MPNKGLRNRCAAIEHLGSDQKAAIDRAKMQEREAERNTTRKRISSRPYMPAAENSPSRARQTVLGSIPKTNLIFRSVGQTARTQYRLYAPGKPPSQPKCLRGP